MWVTETIKNIHNRDGRNGRNYHYLYRSKNLNLLRLIIVFK